MKKLLLVFLILGAAKAFSQSIKTGKVSKEEILEKAYPADPSAPAVILNITGKTYFDFDNKGEWVVVTEVTVRTKVYSADATKYATLQVPFKQNEEVIFDYIAVYNLNGGKITKTTGKDDKIVKQGGNAAYRTVTLNDVKQGTVIEYSYIHKTSEINRLPDWYFQYDIPVKNIEYSVHIPIFFVYNRLLSPYISIKEEQDSDEQTRHFDNPNPKGPIFKINNALRTETGSVTFPENIKRYSAQNVPALKETIFIDNIQNYRSVVKHEIASLQYPNSPKKIYANDWENVAKAMYYENGLGNEIERTDYYINDYNVLVSKYTNRNELVNAIYDFVKSRMAWNGEYGYTTKRNIVTAYQERTGNVAEINLMLVSMLRYAGYNVNPVVLSTRDNGNVTFINSEGFNYVVAGYEINGKIKLLDATNKNAVPGILPVRAINGKGRIINRNLSSAEVDLTPNTISKEATAIMASIQPDGTVTGKVKNYYFDYSAFIARENIQGNGDYKNLLQSKFSSLQINEASISADDFTKPVIGDFSFTGTSMAEVKGDKMYLSPMLMYTIPENPLKELKRSWPLDFIYPQQKKYTFSISIPQGYIVESVPQPAYYQIKDNVGGFSFNASVNQKNQVQVVVVTDINYAMLGADYYPALQEFYTSFINKQSEKIVMKKL